MASRAHIYREKCRERKNGEGKEGDKGRGEGREGKKVKEGMEGSGRVGERER